MITNTFLIHEKKMYRDSTGNTWYSEIPSPREMGWDCAWKNTELIPPQLLLRQTLIPDCIG